MTRRRRWLLVALLPQLLLAAPHGVPRVTLEGDAIPLGEALERVGRQLNHRIGAGWARKPLLAKAFAFHLRDLEQRDALTALSEATGYAFPRNGHGAYQFNGQPYQPPRSCLGQPLPGGWVVWFEELRAQATAAQRTGRERPIDVASSLTARFNVQPPNEVEAARVLATLPLTAAAEGGADLPAESRQTQPFYGSGGDPLFWGWERNFAAPPRELKRLARVGFQLLLARLRCVEFSFDLTGAPGSQLQTDGDVDATLVTHRSGRLSLQLSGGPLPTPEFPPSWSPEQALRRSKRGGGLVTDYYLTPQAQAEMQAQLLRRDDLLDARLYTAAGKPLYTTHNGSVPRARPGERWVGQYQIASAEDDRTAAPARLDVCCWLPVARREVLSVEFRNLTLPPLD